MISNPFAEMHSNSFQNKKRDKSKLTKKVKN